MLLNHGRCDRFLLLEFHAVSLQIGLGVVFFRGLGFGASVLGFRFH